MASRSVSTANTCEPETRATCGAFSDATRHGIPSLALRTAAPSELTPPRTFPSSASSPTEFKHLTMNLEIIFTFYRMIRAVSGFYPSSWSEEGDCTDFFPNFSCKKIATITTKKPNIIA
jgi:hypothetical protein